MTVLLLACGVVEPVSAFAAHRKAALRRGADGVVSRVPDGDSVVLSDGRIIRLAGIEAPQSGRGDVQPFAAEATRILDAAARGRHVVPWFDGDRIDRWGRLVAYVQTEDGRWLADSVLDAGGARVIPIAAHSAEGRTRLRAMMATEAGARTARRGLWALDHYRVRDPADPGPAGSFQLIEGRVVAVATRRTRWILDFGDPTGLVAIVAGPGRKSFRGAGIDLRSLNGRRVRVRGWLVGEGRPTIEVTTPEQIEVVN